MSLDLVREVKPPFSTESVVAEFAATLKSYGINRVTGDRWGRWRRGRGDVSEGLRPGDGVIRSAEAADGFTVSASITVNTLPLMLTSNTPINNLREQGQDAVYPGYNASIYANSAGGRPTGAPLGSTGYQPLARTLTPLATPIALTAGLYWMVTEFYQQSQQSFPAVMALGSGSGGSMGGAALLGIANIGVDARTIAGLSLGWQPGTSSLAAPTLTGSEAWQDLPPSVGSPAVWLGL